MNLKTENKFFKQGCKIILGVDEVGRGALAGPVVVGCVAVVASNEVIKEVKDSKLLSAKKREVLSKEIQNNFISVTASASAAEVDKLNIHNATLLAMKRAVEKMLTQVSCEAGEVMVLVDGRFKIPNLKLNQEAVINGDDKVFAIAAASIVAKVARDNLMVKLHKKFPDYLFDQHKGYGTAKHYLALEKFGATKLHRETFLE